MKKTIIFASFFLIVTIVLGFLFYSSYIFIEKRCCKEIKKLFINTIVIDQNIRQKQPNICYSIGSSIEIDSAQSTSGQHSSTPKTYIIKNNYETTIPNPDSLQHIYQTLLYHVNPINVVALDSIFNNRLKKTGLNTKTAIRYTDNLTNKITMSLQDLSFLRQSYTTGIIKYGIREEISLEGFAELPVSYILYSGKDKFLSITIIWFLTIVAFIYCMLKQKSLRTFNPDLEIKPTVIISNNNCSHISICDSIYLNTSKFLLVRNETTIPLTELLSKILLLFLNKQEHYLTYDEIIKEIWGKINGQERLTQSIKRLRKNLKECPEISIENVRGYGYKLIIKPKLKFPET